MMRWNFEQNGFPLGHEQMPKTIKKSGSAGARVPNLAVKLKPNTAVAFVASFFRATGECFQSLLLPRLQDNTTAKKQPVQALFGDLTDFNLCGYRG
ncbi:MAG: hypothetical protein IPL65_07840 [Lewinellaceae bacterium]|nr:hypothetical protein [Lewinellaceae bacterium]